MVVISANELRGGSGNPFWDLHVNADLIEEAARLASSATVDSSGTVLAHIDDAEYPWAAGGSGSTGPVVQGGGLVDVISPGHTVTNPGHTIAAGWAWHMATAGRGGVDWDYAYGTDIRAMGAGTVDHFNVSGVGMVTRLVLDTPVNRSDPQEPSGDAYGPIKAVWYEHTSASYDGHVEAGDIIGKSGDGGGLYQPHLHVHGLTDTGKVAGSGNRSNVFDFLSDSPAPPPYSGPKVYAPKVNGAPVSTIDGVSAGGAAYVFTLDGFAQYMTIMQGAPWVTSGITDVRLVPGWVVGNLGTPVSFTPAKASTDPEDPMWDQAASIPMLVGELHSSTTSASVLAGWRETALNAVGADGWRKLITSQFTDLMVGNGETLHSFLPEQWQTDAIAFDAVSGAAHGDPSIRVIPSGYNALGSQMGVETPVGGSGGLAHSGYGIAGSNPIQSDMQPWLAAYSSHQSWAAALRNKALSQQLGYKQIQLGASVQGIQAVMGAAQSAGGGAVAGGASGAIGGAAAGAIGAAGQLATAGIQASNQITMIDSSENGAFDIVAFQLALSSFSTVKSFDAWKQSLSAASGGGTPSRLASAWRAILGQAFHVIVAMPGQERVRKVISEWKRYGYMVGQAFTPPRLDVMTHWSYWQLGEATILGALPQDSRDSISRAFQRGVTVWQNVAEIGTQPANEPVAGVTY